ncbi:MAG: leucyl aminopeptidase [Anaerolineae bacterium]|nr:leucyl aminopeptidase [Anaerolineae bacterium]
MEVRVKTGAIEQHDADAVIVNLFDDRRIGGATQALDRALNGAISALIAGGDLSGKAGETVVFYPTGAIPARRVIVVGLGKREEFSVETVRRAAAHAVVKAREVGAQVVGTIVQGSGAAGLAPDVAAQAVVEGSLLALYRWRGLKTGDDDTPSVEALELVVRPGDDVAAVEAGARAGQAIAEGAMLARDLVNNPPNVATPTMLAETAREIAGRHGLRVEVLDRADVEKLGMGAFLGVAQGTEEPPKFIILEHRPDAAGDTVVLVGKGITFDTGGISLKPSDHMETMKSDMAGAAAVLGAMQAVAALDLPVHVVGLVPATDNMPSGHAYKPADVVKAMNGKTIEIISTDAEGRLILADALCYAARYKPAAVIDLATLTGACVVALGAGMAAGLFCEDDALRGRIQTAADATSERVWHMPQFKEYLESIKSDTADVKNSGGRMGGVGTSAMFLRQFAEGYSWAHLDIAGMAGVMMGEGGPTAPYQQKGASGFGVRLLTEIVRNWS